MNREIKFRVWDKLEKRFIYSWQAYQGHYILTLDGKFHNLQNGSGGDEYVVQQYTGLKDKDGKPIYEGDILRIFNHHQWEVVEYEPNGSGFGFFLHDDSDRMDGNFEFLSHYTGSDGYVVLGNIFQEPEPDEDPLPCPVCGSERVKVDADGMATSALGKDYQNIWVVCLDCEFEHCINVVDYPFEKHPSWLCISQWNKLERKQ